MTLSTSLGPAPLLVVCLCAQWCGTCCDYRERFEEVQRQAASEFPQARFFWIDIEDEAELIEPLDVTDFPTLLLVVGDAPRFFGPLRARVEALQQLLRDSVGDTSAPALSQPQLLALVARIRAAKLR